MIQPNEQYLPLFENPPAWRYCLLTGGRGSGKSWHVALFLLNLTYEEGHTILYTRYTLTAAHISIIPEFIDKIELLNKADDFDITKTEITNTKTGSRILFRGIKTSSGNQTANLKSIQGVTTFILDEAEELVDESIFDTIDLSIRAMNQPNRVVLLMNPSHRGHWVYKRFIDKTDPTCRLIHTTYLGNRSNLSQSFLDQAARMRGANLHRYNHIFLGHWIDDAEGLLWTRSIIDRCRIEQRPELKRVVVAIDPAATANKNSDETGIVVAGRDMAGNGYILDDLSGKYSPNEWGKVAVSAARTYGADCIVAEVNQGGDMVENVIRQIARDIRYNAVRATKGKAVRAEPVFSLYEQGKVWHVGNHPILELQMVTFNPDSGDSPDRVDALVWGLTELMFHNKREWFAV
jgi:PBSX family phage terminase large subunit